MILTLSMLALISQQLVVLHTVDGHEVAINPAQVTSLHAAKKGQENKLLSGKVSCLVSLTDGKFVSVAEDCNAVIKALEEIK